MALGFVLVQVKAGTERTLFRELVASGVADEIFPLFGEYDFILKIKAEDFNALGRRIVAEVRSLPGVRKTMTFTVTQF